jgi:hypothetical protein
MKYWPSTEQKVSVIQTATVAQIKNYFKTFGAKEKIGKV